MRIVVTGGKGELGTEVVRKLQTCGAAVTSVSRRTGVDLAIAASLVDVETYVYVAFVRSA